MSETARKEPKRKFALWIRETSLDMAMDNKIIALHEKIRTLQKENSRLTAENEKLQKALNKKNMSLLRSL